MKRTAVLIAIFLAPTFASAQNAPATDRKPPSPEAVRAVEARRKGLGDELKEIDIERLSSTQRAGLLEQREQAFKDLEAALASEDSRVFSEAVRDLSNNDYGHFPKDRILQLLLPRLKKAETERHRMVAQGSIMELIARRYGPKARAALPDLLALVTNDKVDLYLRGCAIGAAADIGPGDEAVVKAFIVALKNPNPKDTSGIHDRIAKRLGDMGKAAAPAREALLGIFNRGDWYQDPAFVALGKIGRDDPARSLQAYLDLLQKLDRISVEQAAVAFHHVVAAGKTGQKRFSGSPRREEDVIDPEVAKAARPVLLKIVEDHPNDVYSRAAMEALRELGPGSSPRAAKAIVGVVLRDHSWPAIYALERLEPTDPEAAVPLVEAFPRADSAGNWHTALVVANALARYGKAARPAVPQLSKAMRAFQASPKPDAYADQFGAYAHCLGAIGADDPDARQVVLDLLDPASGLLMKAGPVAPTYQSHLLLALAMIGVPAKGEQRQLALVRIQAGLAGDNEEVFRAAADTTKAVPNPSKDEARPLVAALARVLAADFQFKQTDKQVARGQTGVLPALQALAALGPMAQDALPAVEMIAKQELKTRESSFMEEPAINAVIREARKTAKAIRTMPEGKD